jgi:hypothetical protein
MLSLVILLLSSAIAPSLAQSPAKSIKDQLVGHWQLVSVTVNGNMPYGANPQGSMFLDAEGHYAIIVVSDGKARSISYFGTYTVNDADNSMTLHVDASSRARGDGHDQKRMVTFNGDELIQQTPPSSSTVGSIKLIWKH